MSKELNEIKRKICPILKKFEVKKAGIFGSYARGEQNNQSDIDILVEVDKKADIIELIKLKINLERATSRKVDLVEYELIRQEIKENVLKEEIPIEV